MFSGPKVVFDPTYYFWTQNFLGLIIFPTKIFWTQIFMKPTFVRSQHCFGPYIFLTQNSCLPQIQHLLIDEGHLSQWHLSMLCTFVLVTFATFLELLFVCYLLFINFWPSLIDSAPQHIISSVVSLPQLLSLSVAS